MGDGGGGTIKYSILFYSIRSGILEANFLLEKIYFTFCVCVSLIAKCY